MRLPRYDDPQPSDEILLVGADGRPNNLHSHVQQVLASDYKREMHEVKDDAGREIVVRRVGPDKWMQVLDWED